MEAKTVVVVWVICSVMIDISYAGKHTVGKKLTRTDSGATLSLQVTDDVCNGTTAYTLDQGDSIIFAFMPNSPLGDGDVGHTFTHCVFTIYSVSTPICIRSLFEEVERSTPAKMVDICSTVFNYFIGYLPDHLDHGFSCPHWEAKPLCDDQSKVYAVFVNTPASTLGPVSLEVYAQRSVVATTRRAPPTFVRPMRIPTYIRPSTYRFDYYDDKDDDDGDFDYMDDRDVGVVGNLIIGAIGAVVAGVLIYICIGYMRYKSSGNTDVPVQDKASTCKPTHNLDTDSLPTNLDEAPPYSDVMLNPRTYAIDDPPTSYIHIDETPSYQYSKTCEDEDW